MNAIFRLLNRLISSKPKQEPVKNRQAECPRCTEIAPYYRSLHQHNGDSTVYYRCRAPDCGAEFDRNYKSDNSKKPPSLPTTSFEDDGISYKWLFCPKCKVQHQTLVKGKLESTLVVCHPCWDSYKIA